jgi:GGDEF domain-containing protein
VQPSRVDLPAADADAAVFGKRVLVELSHAIERFALAAPAGHPMVVVAMFQKLSYFRREAAVYRDIAARGAVTVVGVAEQHPPQPSPGVRHVLLDAGDELAREWSVTVLGPRGGAALVAVDQQHVDPFAPTIEDGRRFRGRCSFRRRDAYAEVLRLRERLRLPAATATAIDDVLRAVLAAPEPMTQEPWDAPLRFLADRVRHALGRGEVLQARLGSAVTDATQRDPRTGLWTPASLRRWTAGLGGAVPLGLGLVRVPELAGVRERFGLRAEHAALTGITAALSENLTPADRVVRTALEDFLLVLPSRSGEEVLAHCELACTRVAGLVRQYPFVALSGVTATTVSREHPLPLPELLERVDRAHRARTAVAPG